LEEFISLFNEINSILELGLLSQNFNVKKHEWLVELKARLLHELKHQQVCDIEDLSLKLEIKTDEVHALYRPLCMGLLLMGLVEGQSLILLLQQSSFSDIGIEQLFRQVSLVRKQAEYEL